MKEKIIIIGAGGQAKNTSLIIEQTGKYEILGFADDDVEKKGKIIRNYLVLGTIDEVCNLFDSVTFVFAIGNSDVVEQKVHQIKSKNKKFSFPNIIHPSVQIDYTEVSMGEGNVVFPGCIFLADIKIGNFNFFNFKSVVSHEATIDNYCLIQAGVYVLGKTIIKDKAYCGVNSTIKEKTLIGRNSIVGAGAVVIKDVEDNAVVVGNPARVLRYKQ